MANGSQFLLLTLKNFKIKGRNGCGTAIEVLFPVICLAFLIAMFVIAVPHDPIHDQIPLGFQPTNITYGPNVASVRSLMLAIVYGQEDLLHPVDTEEQMAELIIDPKNNITAGVFFRLTEEELANDQLSDNITYSIRMNAYNVPGPSTLFEYATNTDATKAIMYYNFAAIQKSLDQAIMAVKIQEKTGTASNLNLQGYASRFPEQVPETELDVRWQLRNSILKPIGGTWITFCLLFSVYRIVGTIIVEKKTKVVVAMRMMGMRNELYWLTWFIVSLVLITPVLVGCAVLLKYLNFFPLTSIGYVFIIWYLYAASLIAFAMIFAAILNSAKSSGLITLMVLVILSIAGAGINVAEMHPAPKIVLSVFSPVALNIAISTMAEFENLKMPADDHLSEYLGGRPSLYSMIAMLVVDTVLYLVIAWYIDGVKTSGSKSSCFCCRSSYWGKRKNTTIVNDEEELAGHPENPGDFEKVEHFKQPVVSIQKLRKKFMFDDQPFIAVEGFSLDMYEGQILALLGHNGAGKTTLISMLTGSLDPTSGEAEMYGNSLTKDLTALKKIIGICPQYDAIWPQLTVFEHLQLFGGFKGMKFSKVKAEAEQLIQDFELEEKRDYPAGKLSGGQKRKLSIAMALIGGSKVVFLDEPSAGMDPEARRVVWDNLVKHKEGRVIIITTHFMDEADYLGDRIAIMKQGKLLCAGSSLFLKNRFGLGYTLNCVKTPSCDIEALTEFLKKYEDVQILSNIGAEAIYRIPRDGFRNLPGMLNEMETHKESLGVVSYGVGQSTLEEVFLELNMDSDLQGISEDTLKETVFIPASDSSNKRQLNALLNKRKQVAKRDVKFLLIQFAVPIILCIAAFVVQRLMFTNTLGGEIALNGQVYDGFITPWSNGNCSTNFLSSLPNYSPDLFPEVSMNDITSVLSNPDTYAAGSLINLFCLSAGPTQVLQYGLYYNASLPHSMAIHQNLVSNAVLNTAISGFGSVTINTVSNPVGIPIDLLTNLISVLIFLLILIGSCVLSASITAFIFQEREIGIKQLQLASGTNAKICWLSNFIWDFTMHMIIFIVIMIVATAADYTTFGGKRIGASLILIILYSLASVSISYFLTFVFSGSGSGQGAILGLLLGLSFGFLTLYNAVSAAVVEAQDAMNILSYVFKVISPHFLLIASFGQLTNSIGVTTKNIVTENTDIFGINYWGTSFIIFGGQFFLYGLLTLLLENMNQLRLKQKRPANHHGELSIDEEDDDVMQERDSVQRANPTDTENNLVWVSGLRKEFNGKSKIRKVAVNNFSLRIPRGESFGLLGANGAGKTTTLKMLSGQLLPTLGEVRINGNSYENLDQILQSIGYCPQYDSVIPKLSGRAHLELFAELRGLPKHKIPAIVDALIETIHLTKYADRPCGKYSGGNRRKLSLALALIGNPPVLYLDEPSTGMDPLARRFMWNLIMAVRSNKAIILTTHSMEECEALCTRLGIMIGGKLRCVGSPQHLKTKFGDGYRLELKTDLAHADQIPRFIEKISKEAKLVDQHTTLFNYEIPMQNLTLGQLFEQVENAKEDLHIGDYAVSQTTLEQIFITMAQEYLRPRVVVD